MDVPTVDARMTKTPPPYWPMGIGLAKKRCMMIAAMTKQPVVIIGRAKLATTITMRDCRKSLLPFFLKIIRIIKMTKIIAKLEPAQMAT